MILHWLSTAWRSLISNPLFSLITIVSLSVGCCGAILAGSNIVQHLSYERWIPDAERIAKVTIYGKGAPASMAPSGRSAAASGDGSVAVKAMSPALGRTIDDGRFHEIVAQVLVFDAEVILKGATPEAPGEEIRAVSADPTFFDVFDLPVLYGDAPGTLLTPDKVIVTESFARRVFGTSNVVGKAFDIAPDPGDPSSMQVGAVIRDLPAASHFDFEVLAGAKNEQTVGGRSVYGQPVDPQQMQALWGSIAKGSQYVRFAPRYDFKANHTALEDTFTTMMQTADGVRPEGKTITQLSRVALVPLLDLHLAGPDKTGLPSSGDPLVLFTLGGAALALLGASAFNYVILSLASSLRRRKEVAIRKVLGAGKGPLVRHYLAEAALVAAISLAIGFAAAELLQPWFARVIAQPDALVNLYDGWFLGIGGATLLMLALAVGFYPAFYLASVRPCAGLDNSGGDNLGPVGRTVTSGLLALQVGAATVLLALALTMGAQARFITERPLGFTLENMYQVSDRTCPEKGETACRARRIADIKAMPGVEGAAGVSGVLAHSEVIVTEEFGMPGRPDAVGRMARLNVNTDFLQLMGAQLLAGRLFDASNAYDRQLIDNWDEDAPPVVASMPVVITRAMLPLIGAATPEDAIGKRIQRRRGGATALEIVGVVEDWNQRSLRYQANPLVFVPGAASLDPIVSIKPENAGAVIERIMALAPQADGRKFGGITVTPLADTFSGAYAGDERLMAAVLGFAGVAILVACLGVYGLTAFDMRRRVREIGIRKALGATPRKVAGMVLGRQMAFIVVASIVSWPVGYWLASAWLEQFAYRTALGPVILPVATLGVMAFAALAISLNTLRAAAIRPNLALRTAG